MKLSKLIAELKAMSRNHGNIEVCVADGPSLKQIAAIEFDAAPTADDVPLVSIVMVS